MTQDPSKTLRVLRIRDLLRLLKNPKYLIVAIIALSLLGLPLYYFVNLDPTFNVLCTTCHNMVPFYEGISETDHGAFNCHTCHPLGPQVVYELYLQIVESPSADEVREHGLKYVRIIEPCERCHTWEEIREVKMHSIHEGAIRMARACNICHQPHFKDDMKYMCVECHNFEEQYVRHLEFHKEAVRRFEQGDIDVCGRCHSPQAVFEVKIAPDCFIGVLKGQACFECHNPPLDSPEISRYNCLDCHSG